MKILIYSILFLMGIWPIYALAYCLINCDKLSDYLITTLLIVGMASVLCSAFGIANKIVYDSVFGERKKINNRNQLKGDLNE